MQTIQSTKSLARLFRQIVYIPSLYNRWLNKTVKAALTQAITQAELGHRGEIYLIIENHLPIANAYSQDCRERALYLFATHKVWDTEHNSGVLVYVNLCEHDLEIIADRGIDQKAHMDYWQKMCDDTVAQFRQGKMQLGLTALITQIGELLKTYYPSDDEMGNELSNQVTYLK
ncbi:TPM domain-containing protein [Moraxella catarrhalis]|uniref:TPM domain-containing protein n=1 Tax=Moraxella catarrhalis TaxID=480 RepID=A0A198UIL3_MORCA|nr:TPM domain-containing protein [Moraxella catarrhalis]OAU96293.1 hypothetical protein AO384_0981 [Moraxella catarrhalis]OAU97257.1 hypothetical protein AO383_1138 [Moraxella catarrhalis]OAV04621.1 hypothetical protein AO385_0038 [Moraxella catarrhalis]